MSRTFRNNSKRRGGFRWLLAKDGKGDSKPFSSRFKSNDGKGTWRCRCEDYCVMGWRHKHARRNHPLYDGEIDDGLQHSLHADDPEGESPTG